MGFVQRTRDMLCGLMRRSITHTHFPSWLWVFLIISNSICLALLIWLVWAYKCRIHLPNLEWGCHSGLSSIVEQEQPSSPIDCPCWVNPGCHSRPSTLNKAFNYRMIHLNCNNQKNPSRLKFGLHNAHKSNPLNKKIISKWEALLLTSTLKDNFSPSSTGTALP